MISETKNTGGPLELEVEREQFNLEIRKRHRGQIFSKRRFVQPLSGPRLNDKYRELDGCQYSAEYIQFNREDFAINTLGYLSECLVSGDQIKILYGLVGIRKLLAEGAVANIQLVIDLGASRQIIALARDCQNPCFQVEAAWCITNIASGTTEQCQSLVDKGVIPIVVSLFTSKYNTVIQQAIWAVANIGGDNSNNRDELLSYGILQQLVLIVERSHHDWIQKKCLWAIANLCRGKPAPKFAHIKEGIRALCKTLRENDFESEDEVYVHIASAIHLHCNNKFDRIQFFLEEGIVPRLVDFLGENQDSLVLLSLKILGNIVTGNVRQTSVVLEAGIFTYLQMLMSSDSAALKREVCWILSNLAGSDQTIAEKIVFNDQIVQKLMEMLEFDPSSIQKEIVWIFNHASDQCNAEDFMQMVKQRSLMRHLVRMLDSLDDGIVECSLETIDRLLALGVGQCNNSMRNNPMITELNSFYGIEKLESMQTHNSVRIFKVVSKMLSTYFDLEEPAL